MEVGVIFDRHLDGNSNWIWRSGAIVAAFGGLR